VEFREVAQIRIAIAMHSLSGGSQGKLAMQKINTARAGAHVIRDHLLA
jgi:hypothetical protein